MKSKYAIVIDASGYKVEFVLVDEVQNDETGKTDAVPQGYKLDEGEMLIYDDVPTALSLIKPHWNGSTWEEMATSEEVEKTLTPLETLRTNKLAELGNACTQAIYAGVDVTTSQGVEHFALTDNDQINISNLTAQVQAGVPVLYHADGKLCRMFTPDEVFAVETEAIAHKTYHTTLCNHYNVWARRAETREELQGITYGADLPKDLAESMAALVG